MKTKITACIVVTLMLLSGLSQAQYKNRIEGKKNEKVELTDKQKDELRTAKITFSKATINVKNELNELRAYQKTLMSAEKLDDKKIFENIDRMTVLKKQLMEERINMRLATSSVLDDDQKMFREGHGERRRIHSNQLEPRKRHMQKGKRMGMMKNRTERIENVLGLSDKQKEQMKSLKVEHNKATQNLREEMKELRLNQRHQLNDDQPNKEVIFSNIDRISSIQNKLAKERVISQKQIREILDDDQLTLFLSSHHRMQKHGKMRKHKSFK